MATKKIEILENTLLKLLVRRGLDVDRRNIVLSEGEIGYTTDTERLYIGNGSTKGGILVGNKFLGSRADHTSLSQAIEGDLAFNTTNNKLYAKTASSWIEIGSLYKAGNSTISIDNNNQISVGTLSANNFSNDAVGNSIVIESGRVSLNGTSISTDSVVPRNSTYLNLPGKQTINSVNYNWPTGGVGSNLFLQTDITGNLNWSPATAPTTFFFNSTGGPIPVGTIMPYVSASGAPYGWLLCNGQEVTGAAYPALSAVIGNTFGSTSLGSFKVPDYINKTLYGTNSNPAGSTIYRVSSGTNSSLSAQGSLFIIKAIPDTLASSTLTISDGLTSYVNGLNRTSLPVSPLSGNIQIGLEKYHSESQTIAGGTSFSLDTYGRVTSVNLSSTFGNTNPAGRLTAPYGTDVYNAASPISFLRQPVQIIDTSDNNSAFALTAYPFISNKNGASLNKGSLPPTARNVIVECFIEKSRPDSGNIYRFIWSAPNISLLGTSNNSSAVTEYLVGACRSSGGGDSIAQNAQVFLPLSAATNGTLGLAFRVNNSSSDNYTVKIVGYTL